MSTERIEVDMISMVNNSLCIPHYLTFVLSYRRLPLVWHKSVKKQCLIKETSISKHLHHKEPLVPYSESDTTRRLHHTEPLVRPVKMYTKVTRPSVFTTQPLVRHVKMYTKVTRPSVCTTQPLVRHVKMYTKVTRPAFCTTQSR